MSVHVGFTRYKVSVIWLVEVKEILLAKVKQVGQMLYAKI
jgi:hypothetical protein